MEVDSVGIIAILSTSYHTHSKNLDKCGKNLQSVRRKRYYHTKCGKNSIKFSPCMIFIEPF